MLEALVALMLTPVGFSAVLAIADADYSFLKERRFWVMSIALGVVVYIFITGGAPEG